MNNMKETPNPRDERKPLRLPEFVWHIPFYLFCLACVYTLWRWASQALGL